MKDTLKDMPIIAASHKSTDEEVFLYAQHKKIYPRWITGRFTHWRIVCVILTQLVFYLTPWLLWNDRQAVLFDLVSRKFYLFGLILLPQDFIYLAALLLCSAFGLFVWTSVGGRLWCGYACPQTVYTEIFLWLEKWVEGDRPARIKLDNSKISWHKLRIKTTKHTLWLMFALWTGLTFVGYFSPIRGLIQEILTLQISPWESFWVLFYGFATYGNAGFMREQVCKYMCPYARFQSVMFDPDTLIVSYDKERGEPRGARSKAIDPQVAGLGSCINCSMCVQVCPTGIDIRDGLQYECIGCAVCIDACDEVMDKIGYARGLIRYTTENALAHVYPEKEIVKHIFRPRVLMYSAVLLIVIATTVGFLLTREPVKLTIMRDRNTLVREIEDGWLENTYRLQIFNTEEKLHHYHITVSGLPQLKLDSDTNLPIAIPATGMEEIAIRIDSPPQALKKSSYPIYITVEAKDDSTIKTTEKTTFISR
jgi:cytochrome c oxidase accessory protein FixG